ncbi:MAG: hypothetical protein ACR2LL_02355 [Nitrosopumilus sp.]
MTCYPYGLLRNPYPSSPTPTEKDAQIMGGTRHIQAKESILECIKDLYRQSARHQSNENDFRLVTVIQDVGSGKTHLALHVKGLRMRQNIESSYVDLATISPKTKESLYDAIIAGFSKSTFEELREKFLKDICDKADKGDSQAKKALGYGFVDKLIGTTIQDKTEDIVDNKKTLPIENLRNYLLCNYTKHEAIVIQNVIEKIFEPISNLDEFLGRLSAISKFSHNFLGKITVYTFDELNADPSSTEIIKSIINKHLPSSVVMLIATQSEYSEIQNTNVSLFDRLEKANYKIDLAGSNSIDELSEIAIEYIKQNKKNERFTKKQQDDLTAKIRVLCDEFPNFRSVRSLINILYHATEKSFQLNHDIISEEAIDETLKSAFPGLKVNGSVLDVPIGQFLKLRLESVKTKSQSKVKEAISNLINFAHDAGKISKPENSRRVLDAIYTDQYGTKIGVAVVLSKDHNKNSISIQNILKASAFVDKLLIFTNTDVPKNPQATIINIDKSKIVDLLYFSDRYNDNKILEPESEKIYALAKTISIF